MQMENFLTQDEAAKMLRISSRSLARYRLEGTGPAYMKAGHRVLYRNADILAWLDSRKVKSTSEARHAKAEMWAAG